MLSRIALVGFAACVFAAPAQALDVPVRTKAPATSAAPPDSPVTLFSALLGSPVPAAITGKEAAAISSGRPQIDALIRQHAKLNGVPESLVHRIVIRESRYNPRAVGRGGAMGLMQIKTATARAMGYEGAPAGLLEAETNIKYAVKYLAGAYRVADGNQDRAVAHYARGYYYEARRRGMTQQATAVSEAPSALRGRGRQIAAARARTPRQAIAQAPAPAQRPAPSIYAGAAEDRSAR